MDWQNEVPFGEDLFKQTTEPYRRFRNILRILLANLNDFDPEKDAVAASDMTLIDRWILERLNVVVNECRDAYTTFEFRKVFNTINQFCAVDLSALYIDITKDRMYCDSPDSTRRRATQTAMHRVFESLVKLLAPILAYTADEAWEFAGHDESIHLEAFPESDPEFSGSDATQRVDQLSVLRDLAQVSIDEAVKGGRFKKREQAAVTFRFEPASTLKTWLEENEEEALEFLMVSSIAIEEGDSSAASVDVTVLDECPRCRRSIEKVSGSDLCERCDDAMSQLEPAG